MRENLESKLAELLEDRRRVMSKIDRLTGERDLLDDRIKAYRLVLGEFPDASQQVANQSVSASVVGSENAGTNNRTPISALVREAVQAFPDQFGVQDVWDYINKHHPDSIKDGDGGTLSGAVSRLVRKGIVNIVEGGRGRKAAIYRLRAAGEEGATSAA